VARWAICVIAALIASAPFLISIAGHYHLRILHSAPLNYVFAETDIQSARDLLWSALNWRNGAAVCGFILLFVTPQRRGVRRLFITWLVVAASMLAFGYAKQVWPNDPWPAPVPSFHWLFQLRLAAVLLAGSAVWGIAHAISLFARRWRAVPAALPAVTIMMILLVVMYPRFAAKYDFTTAREIALQYAALPGFSDTIGWLRRELPRDSVVLASPDDSLVLLGAAGKKAVYLLPAFSNPYVPYQPRFDAAEKLYQSLVAHERAEFLATASKYDVSYVLLSSSSPAFLEACMSAPFVTRVFSSGAYAVLRIDPPITSRD
jgi:hypothetical protein